MMAEREPTETELNLREHPLSAAWGAKDPGKAGDRALVVLFEGQVLQGWEILVARRMGMGMRRHLKMVGIGTLDPIEYVIRKQGGSLSGIDKAKAVAKCAVWLSPGRPFEVSGFFGAPGQHLQDSGADDGGACGRVRVGR